MTPGPNEDVPAPACLPALPLAADAELHEVLRQVDANQERELWWGAYAARHMLPSLLVCLLLTGAVVWLGFTYGRQLAQPIILGVSSAVWLVQMARWSFRVFGINYRLTTHRLFSARGFLHPKRLQAPLGEIRAVRVEQDRFERLVGVGRVIVETGDREGRSLVLIGVKDPHGIAELIRHARQRFV